MHDLSQLRRFEVRLSIFGYGKRRPAAAGINPFAHGHPGADDLKAGVVTGADQDVGTAPIGYRPALSEPVPGGFFS